MDASDKKIIGLCKEGKKEGYDMLYCKYEKLIYSICYHYTASEDDSLDLLQEVYIKLYKSMGKADENKPLSPWIRKITANTCLNFVRDNKTRTLSLDTPLDSDGSSVEDLVASAVNVEDEISYNDTRQLLNGMIARLPDEMKMAVILRHIQGMSYDNIAKAMSCPVGTVKTYIFRGRKILKEGLKAAGIWEV